MAKDEWYVDGAHDDSYLRDLPEGDRELARSAHRRETMHDPAHDYAYDPGHARPLIGEQGITDAVAEAQEYISETDFDVRTLQDKALEFRLGERAKPAPTQERTSPVADYLHELDDYTKK